MKLQTDTFIHKGDTEYMKLKKKCCSKTLIFYINNIIPLINCKNIYILITFS